MKPGWPGYFSSPSKANADYSRDLEAWWVEGMTDLILQALRGEDLFTRPRWPEPATDRHGIALEPSRQCDGIDQHSAKRHMPISIRHQRGNDYVVTVDDHRGTTRHVVAVRPSDVDRYAGGATPEALLEAAFEFLLEREPPQAILARFELPEIERYFPEFSRAMAARFEPR